MRTIVLTIAVSLVLFLGWQTYESTKAQRLSSASCASYAVPPSHCISVASFGWIDLSIVRLYLTEFAGHAVGIPLAAETAARGQMAEMRDALHDL